MDAPAIGLEVVAGRALGSLIIVEDELIIGRHGEGAGRLADDEEISRSHARVARGDSGTVTIEDLGSTNGTFVNSLPISEPRTLAAGDTIELGGTTMVVRELPLADDATGIFTVDEDTKPSGVVSLNAPPPRLEIRIAVDYAVGTAAISWDEGAEPVRLIHTADGWRIAPGAA